MVAVLWCVGDDKQVTVKRIRVRIKDPMMIDLNLIHYLPVDQTLVSPVFPQLAREQPESWQTPQAIPSQLQQQQKTMNPMMAGGAHSAFIQQQLAQQQQQIQKNMQMQRDLQAMAKQNAHMQATRQQQTIELEPIGGISGL